MVKLKKSSFLSILLEFIITYPKQFFSLFINLIIEGIASVLSMLAIIPLADYLIDPLFIKPSKISVTVISLFHNLEIPVNFYTLGMLFVLLNLLKGSIEVAVKYSILKIKYSILSNLFDEALTTFFKSRWEFFSTSDNGVLLNTLNKELNIIGDTLGHISLLLAQIIQLFIFLAVPLWLNPKLTLGIIILSIIFALPFLLLNKISYKLGKKNTETANYSLGILSEILQAARLILGYGKQESSRKLFLNSFNEHIKTTLKSQILTEAIPKFFQPLHP
jgi:ATP-binding cassette subfamily B protein